MREKERELVSLWSQKVKPKVDHLLQAGRWISKFGISLSVNMLIEIYMQNAVSHLNFI